MAVPWASNKERLVAQGEALYQQRLKDRLEPTYNGQIAAIEVESEDFFVGKSVVDTGKQARFHHPDKLFYFRKIGFSALHIRR